MGVKREASHGLTRAMLVGGAPPVPAPPDEYVSITTDRAGMLIPSASVSVAKTARTSPDSNSSSTTSLKVGSKPAWWAAIPRCSPVSHSP